MKKSIMLLLSATLALAACNSGTKPEAVSSDIKSDSVNTSDTYACPMHPEVTSNKSDKCSKCGMDLEKK